MKNKRILLIAGIVAVLLAVGAVLFFAGGFNAGKSGDTLSYNLALLYIEEIPDSDLKLHDTLLRFESPVMDLGRMKLLQKKEAVFTFSNVSQTPVVITSIRTNCGCTAAEWGKAPLHPGKESEIRVTFEAEKEGVFLKKLFIYCSGASAPLEIAIKGEVK